MCYVGMTRAKKLLYMSYARRRFSWDHWCVPVIERNTKKCIIRLELNPRKLKRD